MRPMSQQYNGSWRLVLRSDGKILSGGTGHGYTIAAKIKASARERQVEVFKQYAERRGYTIVTEVH